MRAGRFVGVHTSSRSFVSRSNRLALATRKSDTVFRMELACLCPCLALSSRGRDGESSSRGAVGSRSYSPAKSAREALGDLRQQLRRCRARRKLAGWGTAVRLVPLARFFLLLAFLRMASGSCAPCVAVVIRRSPLLPQARCHPCVPALALRRSGRGCSLTFR